MVAKWLLGVCVALQVSGIAAGPLQSAGALSMPQWSRLPGTFLLAACAFLLWRAARGADRRYAARIACGMFLGFLGDLVMAQVIPSPDAWLAGMFVFGLGHLFYVAAFVSLGCGLQVRGVTQVLWVLLSVAVGGLIWLWLTGGSSRASVMVSGALAYTLAICTMTGLTLALARHDRRLWRLPLGAALFLLSDTLLGCSAFGQSGGAWWSDLVWVTYVAGQALLATSAPLAARRVAAHVEPAVTVT